MKQQRRPEWLRSHHSKKRRAADRRERARARAIHAGLPPVPTLAETATRPI